jgi:hypothetical protein
LAAEQLYSLLDVLRYLRHLLARQQLLPLLQLLQ